MAKKAAKSKAQPKAGDKKLSPEQFTLLAIEKLRVSGHTGIHAVYSGFNEAFREYFGLDPVVEMQKLAKAEKIHVRPAKGGAVIAAGGTSHSANGNAEKTLKKMGL